MYIPGLKKSHLIIILLMKCKYNENWNSYVYGCHSFMKAKHLYICTRIFKKMERKSA